MTTPEKLTARQIGIFALCAVCLVLDGFDLQAIGFVAPAIVREWSLPPGSLGRVFGAALFGVMIGSIGFSMLADRIGRRPVLIAATVFFAVMALVTAQAQSLQQLLVIRFIAGIGMGAIMPNVMAMVGELSPPNIRVTVMMVVGTAFTAGAALGGAVSGWLIPLYGWRAVFYVGGALPLLLVGLMVKYLPESMPRSEEREPGVPLVQLFQGGLATGTLLLWVINFANLLNVYFLANWLPTVVQDAGYPTRTAVFIGTLLQVAGTIGSLGLGWFVHRLGFVRVLTTCFVLSWFSIVAIGRPALPLNLLMVAVFVAGLCVIGGQAAINALAATFFPAHVRSTGIGSGLGVGRIGAILGPLVAGELLRVGWEARDVFNLAAAPALVAGACMLAMHGVMRRRGTAPTPSPRAL
ncbi:MAG TPA: aromatic acid/H+ symport family MFS transporter [Vicinamibacterales bacterium]